MNTLADTATNVTEAQIPGARPGDVVEIHHNLPGWDRIAQDAVVSVIQARQAVLTQAAVVVRTPAGDVSFNGPGRSSFLHNETGWALEIETLEDPDTAETFYRVLDHTVDPIEYAEEFGA